MKIIFVKEKNMPELACSSRGEKMVNEGGTPLPPQPCGIFKERNSEEIS
jgi:hypothetical protein